MYRVNYFDVSLHSFIYKSFYWIHLIEPEKIGYVATNDIGKLDEYSCNLNWTDTDVAAMFWRRSDRVVMSTKGRAKVSKKDVITTMSWRRL